MNIEDFESVKIALPKSFVDALSKVGEVRGQTVNGLIVQIVTEFLKRNSLINSENLIPTAEIIRLSEVLLAVQEGFVSDEELRTNVFVEEHKADISEEDKVAVHNNKKDSNLTDTVQRLKGVVNNISVEDGVTVEEEVIEDSSENEDEKEENEKEQNGHKMDFVQLAERIENLRGLGGNMGDIVTILKQMNLPTNSNAEILSSLRKVEGIISLYHANPSSCVAIIDAINKGDIDIDSAYDLLSSSLSGEEVEQNTKESPFSEEEQEVSQKVEEIEVHEEVIDNSGNIVEEKEELETQESETLETVPQESEAEISQELPSSIDNNNINKNKDDSYNILRRAIENLNLPKE